MDNDIHSLFESCVEIHPGDDVLGIFKALPHCKGIVLFADENEKPILLVISADIRRLSVNRLAENATVAGKRVQLVRITRKIYYKCTFNDFNSSLEDYNAAKILFPARYRDHVNLPAIHFVKINTAAKWPVFTVVDDVGQNEKIKYFGPFMSRKGVSEFVDILELAFALCKKSCLIDDPQKAASCPYFQMNICKAPCMGKITRQQYLTQIDDAITAATGSTELIKSEFESRMKDYASQMRFEEAHTIKKQLENLAQLSRDDFAYISELSQMKLLHIDVGPKVAVKGKRAKQQTYMAFLIRAGRIIRLADINPDDIRLSTEIQSPAALSYNDISEHLSLTTYSLYRGSQTGLWLNLKQMSDSQAIQHIDDFIKSHAAARKNSPDSN